MLDLLELYEKFDYLVAIAMSFIMWLIGYSTTQLNKKKKRRILNQILEFKKDDVEILVPVRHGELKLSQPYGATEITDYFVTHDEMQSALKAEEMINDISLRPIFPNKPTADKTNNIFCIGGPLSNIHTASYFRDREVFYPITFGVAKESQYLCERNRESLKGLVHECVSNNERSIRINDSEEFQVDISHGEGYIFLAKLSGKIDYDDEDRGTVHICFGNNSEKTLVAVNCFTKYRTRLKKLLKHRSHYCVILKCDGQGVINFNKFYDITDSAFVHDEKEHKQKKYNSI